MFKELGEFIDNVGRATGRMIGQILSDKDGDDIDGMMGDIIDLPDDVHEEIDVRKDILVANPDDEQANNIHRTI